MRKSFTGILVMIIAGTGCHARDVNIQIERSIPETSLQVTDTGTFAPTFTPAPTSTIELTSTVIVESAGTPFPIGFQPVNHNGDWIPLIQEFDGVEMGLVPAGCFEMGSTDEQLDYAMRMCEELRGAGNCQRSFYQVEQPSGHQCFSEPFWIDVYEVTNQQYGSSGAWAGDDLPREQVSWIEAVSHCQRRGGRLPTEAEWEYAARGPDGLTYPWGNDFKRSLLNSCDSSCEWNMIGSRIDDGYPNTAPVGSYPAGASWIGAMDMSGNVWEWTSSILMEYPYNATDGREETGENTKDSRRVIRGGCWFHSGASLLRSAARYGILPDAVDALYGFRCVIPETSPSK
jgi:formylglycine-generating enzyme required for sulfatase activity